MPTLQERREKLMSQVNEIDKLINFGIIIRTTRFNTEFYQFDGSVPDYMEFDAVTHRSCGCCSDAAIQLRFFVNIGDITVYHTVDRVTIGDADRKRYNSADQWLPQVAKVRLSAQGKDFIIRCTERSLENSEDDDE